MKRIAIWLLAILVPMLCLVALGVKAEREAGSAINDHEGRVAEAISALRGRLRAGQAILRQADFHQRALAFLRTGVEAPEGSEFRWLGKIVHPDPRTIAWGLKNGCDPGYFYPYEYGSSRSMFAIWASWNEGVYVPPERILVALGFLSEFRRGHGVWSTDRRCVDEMEILILWSDLLRDRTFSADELGTLAAGLDLLLSSRPRLLDEFSAEYAWFSRSLILQATDSSAKGFSTEHELAIQPGWRSLFSRKICVAGLLKGLEGDLRLLKEVEMLPVWERAAALRARLHGARMLALDRYTNGPDLFAADALALSHWELARIATAVARYQAVEGSSPSSLEALVPKYLPRIPESPNTGGPFLYRPGEVSSPPGGGESRFTHYRLVWTIHPN